MRQKLKNQGGFTLVELMIVVNIIGVLSSIVMYNALGYIQRAREKSAKDSLRTMRNAIAMYSLDVAGDLPLSLATTVESGTLLWPTGGSVQYYAGVQLTDAAAQYLRRLSDNPLEGEDQAAPNNVFVSFYDAPDTSYTFGIGYNFDGWHYYYKINGVEAGEIYLPRSDTDVEGRLFSTW